MMTVQRAPRGCCLPTAFSIVMGIPVATVMKRLVPFRENLGWHIDEISARCLELGWAVIHFDTDPVIYPDFKVYPFNWRDHNAVLIVDGDTSLHAVAWDGKKVYDPKGYRRKIENYTVRDIYILKRIV